MTMQEPLVGWAIAILAFSVALMAVVVAIGITIDILRNRW